MLLDCRTLLFLARSAQQWLLASCETLMHPTVQAASMLALLRERCGEELPAYLSAPRGPTSAAASSSAFAADLAVRLAPDRPDVKPLKALLQQAVKEARQQVRPDLMSASSNCQAQAQGQG